MASRTTDKAAGTATGGDKAGKAPASGAAPTSGAIIEDVRSEDGATLHVEGIGAAAVALGEAVAAGAGGPGVGATQIAEAVGGPVIRTTHIDDGADRSQHRDTTMEPFRIHGTGDVVHSFDVPVRGAAVATRSGRDDILPLGRPSLDPDTVPGRRMATAAAQVRRDGRSYAPGESFPIDFRAHSELVPIGAILATPWDELPHHKGK